jgi:hypothetical protein
MLLAKKAVVLVQVMDLLGSVEAQPPRVVVLDRKICTVKARGSCDSSGMKLPDLDCPGVSKKAHLEINAKQ